MAGDDGKAKHQRKALNYVEMYNYQVPDAINTMDPGFLESVSGCCQKLLKLTDRFTFQFIFDNFSFRNLLLLD